MRKASLIVINIIFALTSVNDPMNLARPEVRFETNDK
jgi:hypothetical protein